MALRVTTRKRCTNHLAVFLTNMDTSNPTPAQTMALVIMEATRPTAAMPAMDFATRHRRAMQWATRPMAMPAMQWATRAMQWATRAMAIPAMQWATRPIAMPVMQLAIRHMAMPAMPTMQLVTRPTAAMPNMVMDTKQAVCTVRRRKRRSNAILDTRSRSNHPRKASARMTAVTVVTTKAMERNAKQLLHKEGLHKQKSTKIRRC